MLRAITVKNLRGLRSAEITDLTRLVVLVGLHLHPAAVQLSAQAIVTACQRGVQMILSTHSLELLDALIAAHDGGSLDEMTVCRTRLERGELVTHSVSGSDLDLARNQIESDLR